MTEASSSIVERIRALEGAGITDVFIKKRVPSYAAQAAVIGDSIQRNYSESLLVHRPKTTKIYQNPANYAPNHSVSSLNSSLSSPPPNRHPELEHDEHEPINHFSNIIPDIYQHSPSIEQRTSSRNELNASFDRAPSIDSIQNEIKNDQIDYRVTNLVSNLSDAKKNLRHVSVSQFDQKSPNTAPSSSSSVNPDEISVQVPALPNSLSRNVSNLSTNSVFKYAKSDSIAMEPRLQLTSAASTDNVSNLNMFNPLGSKMNSFNNKARNQFEESKRFSVSSSHTNLLHKHEPNPSDNPSLSIHESRKNSTSTSSSIFRHELNPSNDPNLSIHESRKSSISVQMYGANDEPNYWINNEAINNSAYSKKSPEPSTSSNHLNTRIENNDSRKSSISTLKAELSPSNSFSSGLNNSNKERSNSININNNNSYNQSNKRLLIYNNNNNTDQVTKAMSQTIHPEHFACWNCDTSLTGSRYILRDDHPYCIRCYEDMFANECEECHKKIGTDSKDLSYKDKHWHEKCFFCHVCKLPLVDKPFGNKNDSLYCSECYNQAFASRCDKCAQIFKPGMKKMEYKGQQFHETCFLCYSCNSTIGTKSFIPKENRIYCVPCYENNFATKCTECMKVISQGGVSYKNQPYHKECFVCTHCQQSLAGQRFTSREDHPYCSDCFGKLFAKKCFACHKPITGIGGTKYISFEDRHWHNDCFMCNRCNSSLVGRGFLTDAMDILCPDCGKNEA